MNREESGENSDVKAIERSPKMDSNIMKTILFDLDRSLNDDINRFVHHSMEKSAKKEHRSIDFLGRQRFFSRYVDEGLSSDALGLYFKKNALNPFSLTKTSEYIPASIGKESHYQENIEMNHNEVPEKRREEEKEKDMKGGKPESGSVLHIAGYENCIFYKNALELIEKDKDCKWNSKECHSVHSFGSMDEYKVWLSTLKKDHKNDEKMKDHTTSPAIWILDKTSFKFVGGYDDLELLLNEGDD